MVDVTVEEMKVVSTLTVGTVLFLYGVGVAVGIMTVPVMDEWLTYGLFAIGIISIVSGIWKLRQSQ